MNTDLDRIMVRFSRVNWLSISTHGAKRRDGAGFDRYVRIGPLVVGIPHGWRRVEALRDMARERRNLIAELELECFKHTGRFS